MLGSPSRGFCDHKATELEVKYVSRDVITLHNIKRPQGDRFCVYAADTAALSESDSQGQRPLERGEIVFDEVDKWRSQSKHNGHKIGKNEWNGNVMHDEQIDRKEHLFDNL